ncbi:urocortin-2 [Choloepus didactylus]|uniref:urocortin-2 n=1 Tax=Choloepus didactylus TaxID=27675 RepID=UPI00189CC6A1|nr:urocortin-2 [Choloepus didactylus]
MTRWALLVLMVLVLGRVLIVSATPVPASSSPPQNCPQPTPCPVASEKPPAATTTGPSAARGSPSPGLRARPRITLSLDVPIGLLHILLEHTRSRAAREQAAANARILAHVGRR